MLLVSAVLLGTSTFAWFSMNTVVTAKNMQVKAKADNGLLINEVNTASDTHWDNESDATQASVIALRPTSTADTKTWYTATSKVSSSSASATESTVSPNLIGGAYTTLSLTSSSFQTATAGTRPAATVYYVDDDGTPGYADGEGYYVKYTYYLKSSSGEITCALTAGAQNLNVSVAATGNTNTPNLDKALRVAVVAANKAYIFAPIDGATTSYYVHAGATATTALTGSQATAVTSIPATTANGTAVDVYVYFEGEDANLNTDNIIAAMDTLSITVTFTLATNPGGGATDNGVSLTP